jgi:hypothetical protein
MNELNDFTIPPGYGEAGVPGFDQTSHLADPPYNAQPPHAVPMDYGVPAFDQISHMTEPPYNAQPPHAVQMGYAAPSMAQTSHYVEPPFNAQPPHAVQMGYAAPGQVSHNVCPPFDSQPPYATNVMGYGEPPFTQTGAPMIGMPYSTPQGTFTFRADGTVDAVVNGQSVTYPAGTRKARRALQDTLASVNGTPSGAKVSGGQAFDLIGGIVDLFKPSGQETPAGGTTVSNTPPPREIPWGTIAIVGASVAAVGFGAYFLLRPKAQEA